MIVSDSNIENIQNIQNKQSGLSQARIENKQRYHQFAASEGEKHDQNHTNSPAELHNLKI